MTTHATGPFDVKMIPQDDKSTDRSSAAFCSTSSTTAISKAPPKGRC